MANPRFKLDIFLLFYIIKLYIGLTKIFLWISSRNKRHNFHFHQKLTEECINHFVPLFVVQLFSHILLFATPWTTMCQAFMSFTISWSLFKFKSIESLMPSNHLILCHPLLLMPYFSPASGSFLMSKLFASGGQSIGTSPSASVLPMNVQDWIPLGCTTLISLQHKGLLVFSNTTVQKYQSFDTQPSLWSNSHIYTWLLKKKPRFWLYRTLLAK